MKHNTLLVAILLATLLAVGCSKDETVPEQFEKVRAESKEATQEMKDYTFTQKEAFVKHMQTQLIELDQDLEMLAAKIEKSSDAVKAEARPKLQTLRDQATQLNKQLDDVKNATESTWGEVKAGSRKAFDVLKAGFQQARQWTSDKIAP